MYKKIVAGLLAVAIVFSSGSVLPVSETTGGAFVTASAEDFKKFETYSQHIDYLKENGYYYEEKTNEDGSVQITTYTGNEYLLKSEDGLLYYCNENESVINGYVGHKLNVNIPSEIEGKPVTKILTQLGVQYTSYDKNGNLRGYGGGGGFGLYNSVNVYIPDTVTQIGEEYTKVDGSIGYNLMDAPILMVYSENSFASEIFNKYGDEFKSYGYHSCVGNPYEDVETDCWYDYEIKDDDTIDITKYRGYEAEVVVPNEIGGKKVTSIRDYTFQDRDSLTSITIPDSVTSIGTDVLSGYTSLKSITVDSNNENYSSEDGVLFDKGKTKLIQYPIGNTRKTYTIPNSVTSISDWAFYSCTNLTSITISNSVTNIGDYVFCGCESLMSITIPNSITSIGVETFERCTSLQSITIPNSVTSIGDCVFSGCTSLTSVTIPNSVTSIGDWAFDGCDSLTVKCYASSTAEQYAIDYDIPYEIITSTEKQISSCTVTIGATTNYFRGTRIKPAVTVKNGNTVLRSGTDYTVSYTNNLSVGTAFVKITGKGKYGGTVTKTFKIVQRSISNCDIELAQSKYYFTGARLKPAVKSVKIGDTELYSGNYKIVSYTDNLSTGTAKIVIQGKNNLTGTVTKTFKINPRSVATCDVKLTKNPSNKYKPTVSVSYFEREIYKGNYTVSYVTSADKKTVKVTIAGKNNLSGKITKTYTVV